MDLLSRLTWCVDIVVAIDEGMCRWVLTIVPPMGIMVLEQAM
jgi:hypothetical protein